MVSLKTDLENNFVKGVNTLKERNKFFELLFNQLGMIGFQPRKLDFESLVKIIVSQQLSNIAANSIFSKIKKIYPNDVILFPKKIIKTPDEKLRNAGISYSKIGFIKSLGFEIINNPRLFENWQKMRDEDLIKDIQRLNGFGDWSAKIILIFNIGRLDVFPYGDSTLRKAYKCIYNKNISSDLKEIKWARPYMTILSLYLWKWVDTGMRKLDKD